VPFRVCARTNKWLLLLSFGQPASELEIKNWKLVLQFRVCARTNMYSHTCWSFKTYLISSPKP
jgi:hypothetical protein